MIVLTGPIKNYKLKPLLPGNIVLSILQYPGPLNCSSIFAYIEVTELSNKALNSHADELLSHAYYCIILYNFYVSTGIHSWCNITGRKNQ